MKKYGFEIDELSYQMGLIGCFSEMVAAKVKKLAFSAAIEKKDRDVIEKAIKEITDKYGIKYYIEDDLIKNNIAPDDYTLNKLVFFMYAKDETLNEYMKLKSRQDEAIAAGTYDDELRKAITVELCRLLSYPEERIQEKYA